MTTPESSATPLVLFNPTANRGNMSHFRALLQPHVEREKAEYVETKQKGEARDRALEAAKTGRSIVLVGGDGTLNEVVNGILSAERRVPLGIVAAGSGNDFAWHTLQLPRDPAAAIERAFHGQPVNVDAGIVNGQYFANSFSVGIDADIAVAASWMKKIPLMSGTRLYYTTTVRQLLFGYHRCPYLKLSVDASLQDQGSGIGGRYVLVAVTNGPTYGAGFRINPSADHADGLFDVCSITYTPLLRALKLLPVVQRGEHTQEPEVTFYRARTVHIECQRPLPLYMQVDGESSSASQFDAEILPGALQVRI